MKKLTQTMNVTNLAKKLILLSVIFLPSLAFAAEPLGNIIQIIDSIKDIITLVIPMAFALILLFFFYGLATFVWNSGEPEAREQGKQKMIWGIVALFVASAVWGLTQFLGKAIGVDTNIDQQEVPKIGN
jgi:hypothetical protein